MPHRATVSGVNSPSRSLPFAAYYVVPIMERFLFAAGGNSICSYPSWKQRELECHLEGPALEPFGSTFHRGRPRYRRPVAQRPGPSALVRETFPNLGPGVVAHRNGICTPRSLRSREHTRGFLKISREELWGSQRLYIVLSGNTRK